ncbi:BQ5605_C021g09300 [Microbotryum silenes-dioicae]|uniref:BQ5605_C021g09300 protein n=1 Tax=Microbotryum silenes-dioicae TaxID=796604 RepID=A0A2X0MK79_9BASI|nr:BQ5605_C021g09300 [Microbotryum silenes-dioicae]
MAAACSKATDYSDSIPEKGGHPLWPAWENDIDASKYHAFYENAREGPTPAGKSEKDSGLGGRLTCLRYAAARQC